jgi:hypothetical protein
MRPELDPSDRAELARLWARLFKPCGRAGLGPGLVQRLLDNELRPSDHAAIRHSLNYWLGVGAEAARLRKRQF